MALAALGLSVGFPAAVVADPLTGRLTGSCTIDVNRSRITLNMVISNTTEQSVRDLAPGDLGGSAVGNASVYIQTYPRVLRELLPGKTTIFRWKGEVYGAGFLDLSGLVTGRYQDGDPASTGVINCPRLTVGNPTDLTPPPTNTPVANTPTGPSATNTPTLARTAVPTNTQRPTRTPLATATSRATRTPIPVSTQRATRTPVPTNTPRPTRTSPGSGAPTRTEARPPTPQPTRTPAAAARATSTSRPTRTPIAARATRTPIAPQPTRTPPAAQPTRTPIQARATRTPRGGNIVPTVPRPGQPTPAQVIRALTADCSLRQTNDQISITMVVHNSTGVVLENVTASSLGLAPEGGALFFDPSGPSPRTHRVLGLFSSAVFQWGGRMNTVGAIGFSASAAATGPNGEPVATGTIDCGIGTGPNGFFDNSTFTGSCNIRAGLGGSISVHVNNRSGEPLNNVEAHFVASSGSGTAQINNRRGPAPRRINRLTGGQTQTFVWQADVLGNGRISASFRADGTRPSGERISTQPIMCDTDISTGGPLPDISVDELDQRASWIVQQQYFAPNHCAVFEGCVNAPGNRTLLKFNTTTPNHGPGDLFLGDPRNNPEMVYSECHQHYHFEDYADYRLFDMQGNLVARGHKQAFCLVDLWRPPDSTGPRTPKFPDCGYQGITAGWADVYDRDLDCQWIDVTGVPNGRYVLEVHVNPARVIRESNYSNNVARNEICIGIPRSQCQ